MKFKIIIFLLIWCTIQSIMAQDKPVINNELEIQEKYELEILKDKMEEHFDKRNVDSFNYYMNKIALNSVNKEYLKEEYLYALYLKGRVFKDNNRLVEADSIFKFVLSKKPKKEIVSIINLNLSFINRVWGNYEEAIENVEIAKNTWTEEEKIAKMNKYYLELGNIYVSMENYAKGLEYLLKSYQYALKQENKSQLPRILFYIATVYKNNKIFNMAILYFKKASEYDIRDSNRWMLYGDLAYCYIKQDNLDSAAVYIDKALAIDTLESFTPTSNLFYCQRCDYYVKKKSYDKALDMGMKAMKLAEDRQNLNYKIPAYECLADIYFQQEKYDQAIKYLDTINNLGVWFANSHVLMQRSDILDKDRKWESSNNDLILAIDKMTNKSGSNHLFRLHSDLLNQNFELLRKENELKLRKAEQKLFNQRLSTFALGFLFLVILIITYFFRKLYKKKEAYAAIVEKQNGELEEMNVFNHKLFYTLGHDLRSPINSLEIIFNEMIYGRISSGDFMNVLPSLKKSVTGTSLTLNNILQWGLIKNEVLKERSAAYVDLYIEVEHVKAMLSSSLGLKKIKFINSVPEDLQIIGDNYKINLIFRNLISNSIKFTPQNGIISIDATESKDRILIKIKDTGIGIEENRLDSLFDSKKSTSGTNKEKGFGVGLSLCKEMVIQMEGKIWVESEVEKGSTFFIEIPSFVEKENS